MGRVRALPSEPFEPAPAASAPPRITAVRLRGRSPFVLAVVSVVGLVAFGWPLVFPSLATRLGTQHSGDAPWVFVLLLGLLLAVLLAEMADGTMDAKAVAVLGVLAGCCAVLRPIGGGVTGFNPMFFLMIPAGRVLGRGFGFLLGALAMFTSALLTAGVGPWLPFQMLGAAWLGFGAGCLPSARGRAEVVMLAGYGAIGGILYGFLLNLWFWPFTLGTYAVGLGFDPAASVATNLHHFLVFNLVTSLGFDIPRAVGNAVLVLVAGAPVLGALRRVARQAAFDAEATFT